MYTILFLIRHHLTSVSHMTDVMHATDSKFHERIFVSTHNYKILPFCKKNETIFEKEIVTELAVRKNSHNISQLKQVIRMKHIIKDYVSIILQQENRTEKCSIF